MTAHRCERCDHETDGKCRLKIHMASKHNEGEVVWHECKFEGCDFKTDWKGNLKKHTKRCKHNPNPNRVKEFKCTECDWSFHTKGELKKHTYRMHNPNRVKKYKCEKCDYKTDNKLHLQNHMAKEHNEGEVKEFKCMFEGCKYTTEWGWSNLNRHIDRHHDEGDNKCAFCFEMKKSSREFEDAQGKHMICNKCYDENKPRIEKDWCRYVDKHLGNELPRPTTGR